MKRIITLFSFLVVSPAMAADLGSSGGFKDEPLSNVVGPCAGVSWTGFRLGVNLGVGQTGFGSGDGTASGYYPDGVYYANRTNVAGGYQLDTMGQVEIGYDYQFRNSPIVIGVFGDVGFGSGTTEFTYSAKARLGAGWGNALFYGYGGYEKARVAHDLTDFGTGVALASLKADPAGFVYGLGVDVRLGGGWSAGVRAERADYGSLSVSGSGSGVGYTANISGTDDRGMLTLSYLFH